MIVNFYVIIQNDMMNAKIYFESIREECSGIENSQIIIWGAGNTATLYEQCIAQMKNLYAFCDSNSQKHGRIIRGKEIISPSEINNVCISPYVLVCTAIPSVYGQIKSKCGEFNIPCAMLDKYLFK